MPNAPLFTHRELQPGVHLHVAPEEKFKTWRVQVVLRLPLERARVTAQALIPFVLRRGSQRFPTSQSIAAHLESLYGAGFGVDASKVGEAQHLEFHLQLPSERFLPDASGLLGEGFAFLRDALFRPVQAEGGFQAPYVDIERASLRRRIEGLVDERYAYALHRCYAHMCANEPFALYRYGEAQDLEHVDPRDLFAAYQACMAEAEAHVFVVGAVDAQQVEALVAEHLQFPRGAVRPLPPPETKRPEAVRSVTETIETAQGVLVLGCRLPVRYEDEGYPALLMYNGVLGAFSHSKLFTEVRERASLAYSAYSRIEAMKGVQALFAGIDVNRYEQARDIMEKQLEKMRAGQVSDEEMAATRRGLVNSMLSGLDDAGQMIHSRLMGAAAGRYRNPYETIEQIDRVTVADVVEIARGVELDTVYFLRDDANGSGGEPHAHAGD